MTIQVTMLQTRRGEGGVMWSAGSTYSASSAFAVELINANLATGSLPTVPPSGITTDQVAGLLSLPAMVVVGPLVLGGGMTTTLTNGFATGFQWYRATPPAAPVAIAGATDIRTNGTQSVYTLVAADVVPGVEITVRAVGITYVAVAGVSAAIAPTTAAPVITGTPTVGSLLAFTQGAVTGTPTPTVAMTLTVGGVGTALPYTPGAGAGGQTLVLTQTATNSAGFAQVSASAVISAAADVTAPTAVSSAVANASPTIVALTLSETMNQSFVPAAGAFTVGGHTVTSVAFGSATVLNVTVSAAFVNAEAARTLAYTQPGTNNLRDAAGNLLASFTGLAITNNVQPVVAATNPRFGYAVANGSGNSAAFATLFASMVNMTGSSSGGRTGSFNTVVSTTDYTWLAVLASAAGNTLRVFDGTGYGGFSGAPSTGIGSFGGNDQDPISSSFLTYTDGNGNVWNMYRSNGKASNFNGLSIL